MENSVMVDIRVVQLLSSRLCHDLAGPAGAVHNGMELLQETGDSDGGATALIANSIDQLNSRLAFYRMAFGLGGLSGRKLPLNEAHDLASAFLKGGRLSLDWSDGLEDAAGSASGQNITGEAVKLLLNMILFGVDTLPRGGELAVNLAWDQPAAINMTVIASGAGAAIKDQTKVAFDLDADQGDPDMMLSAHNVQVFFLQRLARKSDGVISLLENENRVTIAIQLAV